MAECNGRAAQQEHGYAILHIMVVIRWHGYNVLLAAGLATEEKTRLEDKQRATERELAKEKRQHKSKYFTFEAPLKMFVFNDMLYVVKRVLRLGLDGSVGCKCLVLAHIHRSKKKPSRRITVHQ